MISFKEWLDTVSVIILEDDVSSSKRVGIEHFQKMKPEEFLNWLKTVKNDLGGIIKDVKTVGKIDGLGARFGKNKLGDIFFEGSRTGPIFDSGSFSLYATNKGSSPEVIERSKHYDDMLEIIKQSKAVKSLPANVKVVCEIFYNPMAQDLKDGIVFVTVKYDKSKLGSLMTILPYEVIDSTTGEALKNSDEIVEALIKQSTDEIKIINPRLKMNSINIEGHLDILSSLQSDAMDIIKSRKHADRESKAKILAIIDAAKSQLADYILNSNAIEGKYNLGDEIEGIVLHLPHGIYKITTDKFKESKKK